MKWISVEKELPELGKKVDLWSEKKGRLIDYFRDENEDDLWWEKDGIDDDFTTIDPLEITHWRLSPEPPKVGK